MTLWKTYLTMVLCFPFGLFAQAAGPSSTNQGTQIRVPLVGCESDGQLGPRKAPTGKSKAVSINSNEAARLAYYESPEYGLGVLAPRGWYCFGAYGSNGEALYVSPQPISRSELFSPTWSGFTGPVIEISYAYGGTSGRFTVAKVIAHAFPHRRAFVNQVIEEGVESPESFKFGPYPNDKLTYKREDLVEYETPANTQGLGTCSRLKPNNFSIKGVAKLLGPTPDLIHLSVRQSTDVADLTSAIIQQAEKDSASFTP